jgi:putative ABC transport system permease protein
MGPLHLAGRYLAHNRYKTAVLVLSIAMIVFVPFGLREIVEQSAGELTARADATPLLIGAKGSPLELTLSSLYFEAESPEPFGYDQVERAIGTGLATVIPINARFHARDIPIVGTSPEYFEHRGLEVADGRQLAVLGECVVGAEVARAEGLRPGDSIVSSPESVFDLAGVYPLKMNVVGVLAPSLSPDDEAIFVDVKTTWVIAGIGHGHEDLSRPEASPAVLAREGDVITANASVEQYNEITPENAGSFHFHGDASAFPVTAVIAVPHDAKSSAILQGRYQGPDETVQIVRPDEVIDELLGTIFTVQGYVIAAVLFVGGATIATSVMVFLLSIRLRKREIETMIKIGASRTTVAAVLSLEIGLVVAASLLLAGSLTIASAAYASELLRTMILS